MTAVDLRESRGSTVSRERGGQAVLRWCWDSIADPLLSVLFPPRCVGCGDFEVYLCEECRKGLSPVGDDSCVRCGEPGLRATVAGRCAACMSKGLEYTSACAAFRHEGVAKRLVSELKFGGQPVLAALMAGLALPVFLDHASKLGSPEEIIVTWVPSHRAAKRERGYNQAELLARHLAAGLPGAGCCELAVKTKETKHQKALDKRGRAGNLRDAFFVAPAAEARVGRASVVILVDDVYTTGATSSVVSGVLKEALRRPVHVFTFSRAVAAKSEGHD